MNLDQDLNVFYLGGSGGFYFLHQILLLNQHWCQFPGALDPGQFAEDFEKIFQRQWAITNTCDWKQGESWPENAGTESASVPGRHKIYLTCNEIHKWLVLPGHRVLLYTDLQSQIRLSRAKRTQFAHTRMRRLLTDRAQFQGHTVMLDVARAAESADTVIYLQDFVRDSALLGPRNQQFAQQWLALHPEQLLRKINL